MRFQRRCPPCLLLDLGAGSDRTSPRMTGFLRERARRFSHGRAHRCPEVADRLVAPAPWDPCTARLSEGPRRSPRGGVGGLLVTTAVDGTAEIQPAPSALTARQPETVFMRRRPGERTRPERRGPPRGFRVDVNLARRPLRWAAARASLAGGPRSTSPTSSRRSLALTLVGLSLAAGHASRTPGFDARPASRAAARRAADRDPRSRESAGHRLPAGDRRLEAGDLNIDAEHRRTSPNAARQLHLHGHRITAGIGGRDHAEYHVSSSLLTVLATGSFYALPASPSRCGAPRRFTTDRPFPPVRHLCPAPPTRPPRWHRTARPSPRRPATRGGQPASTFPHRSTSISTTDYALRGYRVEAISRFWQEKECRGLEC